MTRLCDILGSGRQGRRKERDIYLEAEGQHKERIVFTLTHHITCLLVLGNGTCREWGRFWWVDGIFINISFFFRLKGD